MNITAKAPAKLIVSGEHAVIYGSPAFGIPLHSYITTTTISLNTGNENNLELLNFRQKQSFTNETLKALKKKIDARANGNDFTFKPITPVELALYLLALYAEQYSITYQGIDIQASSSTPIGAGLGSSAAFIVSSLRALSAMFRPIPAQHFIPLAHTIENLIHGKSSGFDLQLSYQGRGLYYDQNQYRSLTTHFPFQIAHTGTAEATTIECIQSAAPFFESSNTLTAKFTQVTQAMVESIEKQNLPDILKHITKNHDLLCEIGVVPDKVQQCVEHIQKRGNAAKICGAGSCRGEKAGILLIVGNQPVFDILSEYGYSALRSKPG